MICLTEGCSRTVMGRGLCSKHYTRARRRGELHQYQKKAEKFCSLPGCVELHYAKGLCAKHHQQTPEVRERASRIATRVQKSPKRKEQKREAQQRYTKTPRYSFKKLQHWCRIKRLSCALSEEEYAVVRAKPCHRCNGRIEPTGIGVSLSDKTRTITAENALPTCGVCRAIKPVKKFDPVTHARSLLRRSWKRNPHAALAKQKAKDAETGLYWCNHCRQLFRSGQTEIDHILPVIDIETGFVDMNTFVLRLYCSSDNLQILCKPCHKEKTKTENKIRRKNR